MLWEANDKDIHSSSQICKWALHSSPRTPYWLRWCNVVLLQIPLGILFGCIRLLNKLVRGPTMQYGREMSFESIYNDEWYTNWWLQTTYFGPWSLFRLLLSHLAQDRCSGHHKGWLWIRTTYKVWNTPDITASWVLIKILCDWKF